MQSAPVKPSMHWQSQVSSSQMPLSLQGTSPGHAGMIVSPVTVPSRYPQSPLPPGLPWPSEVLKQPSAQLKSQMHVPNSESQIPRPEHSKDSFSPFTVFSMEMDGIPVDKESWSTVAKTSGRSP